MKTVDLKRAIFIALFFALSLSLMSPLGPKGTLVHALGLLSATFYNLKLKKTKLSIFPYIFSFGAMPWAVYLSIGKRPSIWLTLGFVLFASAFHFLNVLKDLNIDISQGILGLPQRAGRTRSIFFSLTLLFSGLLVVILKWQELT
jgi:4-hydroxybenzoate polyprenyltransferase